MFHNSAMDRVKLLLINYMAIVAIKPLQIFNQLFHVYLMLIVKMSFNLEILSQAHILKSLILSNKLTDFSFTKWN